MLTLNDGRNELWQWDTKRKLTVDAECSQVHFSNKVFGRSIDIDVIGGAANIPDILLQTDKDLTAWAFVGTPKNGYTKISKVFKVNKRNKPADYVFTPTEQTTLEEILERVKKLEENPDVDVDLTGYVQSVNGQTPDENGNVEIEVSGGNADYVGVEPAYEDIPKVFFGGALQQTKDEKVVPFRYISKTDDISGFAEIKAQGNSSMGYPKKNQTVKLFKDAECNEKLKVDFKGWGRQNKHVYKANWIDLSHARNVVSARLWADVVKSRTNYLELPELLRTSPNQGAVDGFPVKVYADGVYQGRYSLNIPKDKWMANMDDELDTHCILCSENYVSGCFRAPANINETDWTDEIHDTVPASIKTRWNEVISFVMNSTDEEFRANLGNYFYVDSLIDYHLFGLISCGLDAYGKNQIYATYDGQKWIASMYDMDSTWGLWWNGGKFVATDYDRSEYQDFKDGNGNLLYIRLEQLFWSELRTRWAELKNGALSIANIINRFERFTDIAPAELVAEDYANTTGNGAFTGIPSKTTNNIQQIRAFALARHTWTDEYIASLVYLPCTGISLDVENLTFTGEGTQTLTATVTPDDCTDTITWESSNTSIATVANGVVTPIANGNCTITARCGSHSATCSVNVSGLIELIPCTGIVLNKNNVSFTADGQTEILVATVTPSDTTDSIIWTSSDPTVAKVTDGVVTPVKSGNCTITATCGGYSATCSVSVTGIGIDYSVDALSGVAWTSGYSYNTKTGEKITKSGEHCSDKFTLQNTSYTISAPNMTSPYINVLVWNKAGEYIGYAELPSKSGIVVGNVDYTYAVKVYDTSADSVDGLVSAMPNDYSATTVSMVVINLSALTWTVDGAFFQTDLSKVDAGLIDYSAIDSASVPIIQTTGYGKGTVAHHDKLFFMADWGGVYLSVKCPDATTVEELVQYFTENNSTLTLNLRQG